MALGSHLITVRRLEKYINDVIGKKANLPDTSKTIIGNISQINSDLTNNTCANLLNPTAQTQTNDGVTFTNNGDGTYTVNGTSRGSNSVCHLTGGNMTSGDMELDAAKTYKLLGSQGGSGRTYQIVAKCWKTDGTVSWLQDWKNPIITGVARCTIYLDISNGYTVNNLLFKPMLTTDLNATYDDYVPYTGDSGRLNEDVAKINNDLSAKIIIQKGLTGTTGTTQTSRNSFTAPTKAGYTLMAVKSQTEWYEVFLCDTNNIGVRGFEDGKPVYNFTVTYTAFWVKS